MFINQVRLFEKPHKLATYSNDKPYVDILSSDQLNEKQKMLLKKVINVINKSTDLSVIKSKLDEIDKEASNKLDGKAQLIPIIAATTVANASAKYWIENWDKWKKVVAERSTKIKSKKGDFQTVSSSGPGELVEADLAGATAFSIAALYGCDEATLGACAVPAALTGATATSAADGVKQVYEYIASFF